METGEGYLDFTRVCRLCLSEESVMSSIFGETDNVPVSVPLPLRIMACVSVEISSADGLPSQICATCLCQVDGWYKFKDLCENSDTLLRRYIKNEPVETESISNIQNMAQEVKRYFTLSQNVKEESVGVAQSQPAALECENKINNTDSTNGEPIGQYSLSENGIRSSSYIKEEDNTDVDDNNKDEDTKEEIDPALLCNLEYASENQENLGSGNDFDDSLDNEILVNRIKASTDSEDGDFKDDFSSDDNVSLSVKKKKLLKEKNKVRTKKKVVEKQNASPDLVKRARSIQTQTGTDEKLTLEVIDIGSANKLDEKVISSDKKKIKSRKTQTPREMSTPKKRFRIRPAVPSSCTLCDKVYKNSEILRQHMKSHHVTGTIECPHCKLTFTSLRSLKYHEQRKHSNLEPVPCTFCGKKFLDKKYLRIHENIHSQANQYVCQFCGQKFIMKTNLTVHISRHHTVKTNDFICQVCGKAFPFRLYLKKHLKTHTDFKPYQCNHCEAKFRENTLLKKHVNSIHLKLRPFLCHYCHKTFTRNFYLRDHMESQHLGIQKKFECSRCGTNFQNRNRLRQHECEGSGSVVKSDQDI